MMEARRVNKNEKRKKKRLLRKAAQLSSEDLERIAVLKRCGLETKDAQSAKPKQHGAAQEMSSDAIMQHLQQCTDARGQSCHGSNGDARVEKRLGVT